MKKKLAAVMMLVTMVFTVCFVSSAVAPVNVQASTASSLKKKTKAVVKKVTKPEDTKAVKMKKLFVMLEKKQYGYKRTIGFKAKKGWDKSFALDLLKTKKGSCYGYAAAYGYLVKQATGYPVRVGVGKTNGFSGKLQPHAWTEVKINGTWYVCDSNMDKFAEKGSLKYFCQKRATLKNTYNKYKKVKYTTVKF
ncbi:MAG: transglutaminase domain-containing protein [Anaerobutyricum sp.]|nr:transglutaminase domain-containing protein [Anaerobutyricum sp.]